MHLKLPFHPTRAHAVRALHAFTEHIPSYSERRNFVTPSLQEVSVLSAYIRLRLITEEEVIVHTIAHHDFRIAEKFIQEVCWRSYWKNWLELNEDVWTHYQAALSQPRTASLQQQLDDCEHACTPIPTLNTWIKDLQTHGYLHNHVRMYFASLWIHTLKLPWQYGAALFMKYLYDADEASNTLSWRWVAGLHTKGKAYLAKEDNISFFTGEQFDSGGIELASSPIALQEEPLFKQSRVFPLQEMQYEDRGYLILIHEEELSLETIIPEAALKQSTVIFIPTYHTLTERQKTFRSQAMHDAAERMTRCAKTCVVCHTTEEIESIVRTYSTLPIVAYRPFVGLCRSVYETLLSSCTFFERLCFVRRPWDLNASYPKSSGFFPYWQSIKSLVRPY